MAAAVAAVRGSTMRRAAKKRLCRASMLQGRGRGASEVTAQISDESNQSLIVGVRHSRENMVDSYSI